MSMTFLVTIFFQSLNVPAGIEDGESSRSLRPISIFIKYFELISIFKTIRRRHRFVDKPDKKDAIVVKTGN